LSTRKMAITKYPIGEPKKDFISLNNIDFIFIFATKALVHYVICFCCLLFVIIAKKLTYLHSKPRVYH
jgi:hypothetical protein